MIKLIAIDLDGTLLNSQKKITDNSLEVLQKAKKKGVKVVICTGRPLASISSFIERLGLNEVGDYSITFNGGLIQKNDTGEVLREYTLSLKDVQKVAQELERVQLPADVVSNQKVFHLMPQPSKHASFYSELNPLMSYSKRMLTDLKEEETFNKMVVAAEATYLDEQILKLSEEVKQEFTFVKSRDCLLEVLNKEVSKGQAVANLAHYLGIKQAETMAIGDEANDLSMIEYAGVGVAMENAVEVVKAQADFITTSNDEEGVANVVKKYVFL